MNTAGTLPPDFTLEQDPWADIRDGVRKLCARFPGEYWRERDRERAYPQEFVAALTDAGYLACLIPEQYGGAGLPLAAAVAVLEEIHRSGGNGAACHAQMYIMGALLRHGSEQQKQRYLPDIASGKLRLQAFGVTEPNAGSDTLALQTRADRDGDSYVINGQKVWTSRAEHSDLLLLLARTAPVETVSKRTEGLSLFLVDMTKALQAGLTIRPIRTMLNHATTELFFKDLRIPAAARIGAEGKGFRYILDGMERRTDPGCSRMHWRRTVLHRSCGGLRRRTRGLRAPNRPEPRGAVPDRQGLCRNRGSQPDGGDSGAEIRRGPPLRPRVQHGETAGG